MDGDRRPLRRILEAVGNIETWMKLSRLEFHFCGVSSQQPSLPPSKFQPNVRARPGQTNRPRPFSPNSGLKRFLFLLFAKGPEHIWATLKKSHKSTPHDNPTPAVGRPGGGGKGVVEGGVELQVRGLVGKAAAAISSRRRLVSVEPEAVGSRCHAIEGVRGVCVRGGSAGGARGDGQ
jgi:hypothetical protein